MNVRFSERIEGQPSKSAGILWRKLIFDATAKILPAIGAFLLTRVELFGGYSPLAVAFVAASGGKAAYVSALGAILGYITLMSKIYSMKYIAATVLAFAAIWIFKKFGYVKYKIFSALATTVALGSVGAVFLFDIGFSAKNTALFVTEIGISACAAWFYKDGFESLDKFKNGGNILQEVGVAVMLFSILCCFSDIKIMGLISVVRVGMLVYIMYRSCSRRGTVGAATGLSLGAVADSLNGGQPFFSLVYGIAGLVGGIFSVKGKFLFIIFFIITGAAATIWSGSGAPQLSFLYENFIASVIFAFMPQKEITEDNKNLTAKSVPVSQKVQTARLTAANKIEGLAQAFSEIRDMFSDKLYEMESNHVQDTRIIFDSAANCVCKKCKMKESCWNNDYVSTYNALNDASDELIKKGHVSEDKFPPYFAEKCVKFADFTKAVNNAAKEVGDKNRRKRISTNKAGEEICGQYDGMSAILQSISNGMKTYPACCPPEEKAVKEIVTKFGTECAVSVMKSLAGHICIEIRGENLEKIFDDSKAFRREINRVLGGNFEIIGKRVSPGEQMLVMKENEKLTAVVGVGVKNKNAGTVSGDNGIYFTTDDGLMFLILSDGMGSGKEAAEESNMSIKLLEKLLRNGVPPDEAYKVIEPIFSVRSGEGFGFATLDILKIDLYSGDCEILKCGAAQSYISQEGHTSRVDCTTLPPGMADRGSSPDIIRTKVLNGDFVVMMSDGIAGEGSDSWIFDKISEYCGNDPKQLAGSLLKEAIRCNGVNDDMTVVVVDIRNNAA